jgi:hypothetical protein
MFSGCQRLFLGKNGRHRLNAFKFDPSLTNEMRRSLNLSDIAVNSANGARDFVTVQPNWLRRALSFAFLRNSNFAGEETGKYYALVTCKTGIMFHHCHQQQ